MQKAARPCSWPGCPELVIGKGDCRRHRRPSASGEGYDVEWREFRAWYLPRHPRCRRCGATATVVDHKIPLRAGGARLDPRNAQSLCAPCHARKTVAENPEGKDLARPWR